MARGCGATIVVALAGMAGAGCFHQNLNYCEDAPHHNCADLRDAGSPRCASDPECGQPLVCDVAGTMTCVQCIASEHEACVGTTPVCTDNQCRRCTEHAQCTASGACLFDGSCAEPTQIAYVDPAGSDNLECSKLAPCTKVAKALATNRRYVKFHGTIDEAVSISGGRLVTFLADPGAKLTRSSGSGAIVSVQGSGTSLSVYDLSISDAPNNASGLGCVIPPASGSPTLSLTRVSLTNNPGGGVAAAGGTLVMSQATVRGNTGGGISISGAQFDITNSFIVENGGPLSSVGGLDISQIGSAGSHRLDFNTITGNTGSMTVNPGVNCTNVVVPVTFDSNIIFANTVSGGGRQIGGSSTCTAIYSDVGPDTASGTGNINADPLFVNATQNDFHLLAGSPAKHAADPAATLAVDFDGDARPPGARSAMGADEVNP
jgi:hypothetical protein